MMAKKQSKESPEKQFERFRKTVQEMVDAGELNPTEADDALEKFFRKARPKLGS